MTDPPNDIIAIIGRGDVAALEAALARDADANTCDRWGVSALAYAAGRGDLAAVEALLAKGAQVDRLSDAGNSALMAAAARGHLDVMKRLLDAGADPDHKNKWGLGAHDWAKWSVDVAEVRALLPPPAD